VITIVGAGMRETPWPARIFGVLAEEQLTSWSSPRDRPMPTSPWPSTADATAAAGAASLSPTTALPG
jgi:hypothetical protein